MNRHKPEPSDPPADTEESVSNDERRCWKGGPRRKRGTGSADGTAAAVAAIVATTPVP
jgi:hypothetical protein